MRSQNDLNSPLRHIAPRFVKKRATCMVCGDKKLTPFLFLGKTAVANSFLTKRDLLKRELKVPLTVYYCHACHLIQLLDIVDRKLLFEKYAYFCSASTPLLRHFQNYAEELLKRFPAQAKKLTVEIASNDGILLKPLKERGARVLGVDPARNVVQIARRKGIPTIADFFSAKLARKILRKYGKAGLIVANNVLAHTDTLHDIIAGVKELLDEKGVFVFEVQYAIDLLDSNEFDNTYHEHICYFSLFPLTYLLKKHGLEIFDVKRVDTQGGSIRVFASHSPLRFPVKKSLSLLRLLEHKKGMDRLATYRKFAKRPPLVKHMLNQLLQTLKKHGKKIAGYGAPAKGNTLLQYCSIGPGLIDYIIDTTPVKQNKFTPGTHIPIVHPSMLKKSTPDYILLLAWNYADAIIQKEEWFSKQGGKFIIPVPKPAIHPVTTRKLRHSGQRKKKS